MHTRTPDLTTASRSNTYEGQREEESIECIPHVTAALRSELPFCSQYLCEASTKQKAADPPWIPPLLNTLLQWSLPQYSLGKMWLSPPQLHLCAVSIRRTIPLIDRPSQAGPQTGACTPFLGHLS